MPWPVPSAKTIFERVAAELEQALCELRPDIDPVALSRAVRSNHGLISILTRAVAFEVREIHDHIAFWSRQYFPDTAEEEFVARHAGIWGIERRGATHAVGEVIIEGAALTSLPAGLEMSGEGGVIFETIETAQIGDEGSAMVAARAKQAGLAGNIEAGHTLKSIIPFPEIDKITVADHGFAGGAEADTWEDLREAVLARIRQPRHGGAGFDYPEWLRAKFPVRAVSVVADWIGRGSVGIIVAMKDGNAGRPPTEAEQSAMLDCLGRPGSASGVRQVTAHVVIVPAEPVEIALTIRLRPDSIATRGAIIEAWHAFILSLRDAHDDFNASPIGATIELSRLSEALSAAQGEYAHDLIAPASNIVLNATEYAVAGLVTFAEAS